MKGLLQFLIAKVIFLALASSFVSCYDPSPLQDYCVAVNDTNEVFINGKDPRNVTANDFYTSGLNIPGNNNNRIGTNVTEVNADRIPGLNTLGVSLKRFDFAPGDQVPPHIHPRGSEILVVLQGKLFAGFISSNEDNNKLFSKVLCPGDVFVIPIGLIHFFVNIGTTNVVAFVAGGGQDLGFISVPDAVFGSSPLIDPDVLAKAFALDISIVKYLQTVFHFGEDFGKLN